MASENTHIFLADRIREEINDDVLKQFISGHMDYYFLGSIFPDILFYSKDKQIVDIAYNLHGEDGVPTNRIVFDLLDRIKRKKDGNNFAFVSGLLTHYAADITFHPVVFYFSGYQANGSKREKDRSAYLHWHYETSIDVQINDRFYLDKSINPETIRHLVIPKILGIHESVIGDALKRQIKYFSLTRNRLYFVIFKILTKLGLFPVNAVAGFHENLKKEDIRLPDPIQYKDVITGEPQKTTLNDMMEEAVQLGCRMIETAYAYYTGRSNRDECEKVIAGHSLETGQVGKRTADIRFSANIFFLITQH
ncbi:MAG: zinc dependent phospholipase C family protein [Thermodesulfobacteriota bacterium]|nr:zinc dependent phospholipase C family protein [Thermodesulfobacteriota bacterium]